MNISDDGANSALIVLTDTGEGSGPRAVPGTLLEGDRLTAVDPLGEYSDEQRLAMWIYLENLRRGLQPCPSCGEWRRAWSFAICRDCGGPGGRSEEARAWIGRVLGVEG
jgi:hypothetical protein